MPSLLVSRGAPRRPNRPLPLEVAALPQSVRSAEGGPAR